MSTADWMKDPQFLADVGHGLAGACVLLATVLFTKNLDWILVVEGLLLTYVVLKEYWFDLRYETGEDVRSSTQDAVGYLLGNACAWVLVGVAHAVGSW